MFTYDSYKNRIRKVAAVKNLILRHKVIFICAVSLVLALISGLLIIKGTVTKAVAVQSEIVYGDFYEVGNADAIMSRITYEYRVGGEWTEVKPLTPGEYAVRTVTSKSFGMKGYGKPVLFKIIPRDVTLEITDSELVYGSDPKFTLENLVYGDKLSSIEFEYDGYGQETSVSVKSLKITDENGGAVTDYYNIETSAKNIIFKDKNLTVTPASLNTVYSGATVNYVGGVDEITEKELNGDEITFQTTISDAFGNVLEADPITVGVYTVKIIEDTVRVTRGGVDVTARYNLGFENSAITIIKRPATIITGGLVTVYDGKPKSVADFVANGLADGHEAVCVTEKIPSVTAADSIFNIQEFIIIDASGDEVTENYDVKTAYGEIIVNKRPITVATEGYSGVYDGAEHFNYNYTVTGGVKGQTVNVSGFPTVKGVADIDNKPVVKITAEGVDVTENYEIIYDLAKLTVTAKPITITVNGGTFEYDGGEHAAPYENAVTGGLIAWHNLKLGTLFKRIDAGKYDNETVYYIYDGTDNVTANYTVTYDYRNKLIIKPRNIVVTVNSATKEFDGKELSDSGYIVEHCDENGNITGGAGLIGGDILTVASDKISITNAGKIKNTYVYDGGDNYNIVKVIDGKLIVTPRNITVTVNSDIKIYDGTGLANDGYKTSHCDADGNVIMGAGLIGEDKLLNTGGKVYFTEAGKYDNIYVYDCGSNYNIVKTIKGEIVIEKRAVKITTGTDEREYNGAPLTCDKTTVENIAEGHEIKLIGELIGITDVSVIKNENRYNLYHGKTDVSKNYEITYVDGTLKVTQRKIKLTTESETWTYDGKEHFNSEYEFIHLGGEENAFVLDHGCTLSDAPTIKNVGTRPNARLYMFNGDYGKNYSVMLEYGTLTVAVRDLAITLTDMPDTQYGEPFNYDDREKNNFASAASLAEGDEILITVYFTDGEGNVCTPKTAGVYGVHLDTVTGLNCDINNYKVTQAADSVFTIVKRHVTLTLNKAPDKEYDGQLDERLNEYEYANGTTSAYGETLELMLIFNSGTESETTVPIRAGTYNLNKITVFVRDINFDFIGSYDSHAQTNYDITYTNKDGYVYVISKRNIHVKTGSAEKEYDGKPLFNEARVIEHVNADGEVIDGAAIVYELGNVVEDRIIGDYPTLTNAKTIKNEYEIGVYCVEYEKNDITFNYNIKYDYGDLTVTPRKIKITTGDCPTTYNGEFQGTDMHYIDYVGDNTDPEMRFALVDELGHKTERIGDMFSIKNVWESAEHNNVNHYKIVYEDENKKVIDVSGNYAIVYVYGTVNILPCEATVTVNSAEKEYDGKPLFDTGYILYVKYKTDPNRLYNDHELKHTSPVISITDEGSATNTYKYTVVSDTEVYDGHTVDENYDITVIDGKLTVTPRYIIIKTPSIRKEYDGEGFPENYKSAVAEHVDKDGNPLSGAAIADGQLVELVSFIEDFVNVNRKENVQKWKIVVHLQDGTKVDTTHNYRITYENGWLEIYQRAIQIVIASGTWTYDGDEHKADYLDDIIYIGDNANAQFVLVSGQIPVAKYAYRGVTNVWDNPLNENDYYIKDGDNNDCTGNYDITIINGVLIINQRKISIKTEDNRKEYDGTPLENGGAALSSGSFAKTLHHLEVSTPSTAVNAGEHTDDTTYAVTGETFAGHTLNENYSITGYDYGALIIDKRKIKITTGDATFEYDGEVHFCKDYTLEYIGGNTDPEKQFALVNGHWLSSFSKISVKNVADTKTGNNVREYWVYDATAVPQNYNYDIEVIYGTITITPRLIRVTTKDVTFEYNGDVRVSVTDTEGYDTAYIGGNTEKTYVLAAGHGFKLYEDETHMTGSITNVWESGAENTAYFKITSTAGDESNNYLIAYVYGNLTVIRRDIVVTTASGRFTYDGHAHFDASATSNRLVDGHTLQPKNAATTVTYVWDNADNNNVNEYTVVSDDVFDGGHTVAENYSITKIIYGTLTILKRSVTVTTGGDTWIYDGGAHGVADARFVGGVADTDDATFTDYTQIIDAGSLQNKVVYGVANSVNGKNMIDNYAVTEVFGTLTVTRKPLDITLLDIADAVYGESFVYPGGVGNYASAVSPADGEDLEVKVVYTDERGSVCTPKHVGKYNYSIDSAATVVTGGRGKLSNYSVTCARGSFSITEREISIIVNKFENKVYSGSSQAQNKFTYANGSLHAADGDALSIEIVFDDGLTAPVNAGTYTVTGCNVKGVSETDYIINVGYINKAFEITPRHITADICYTEVIYGNVYEVIVICNNVAADETFTYDLLYNGAAEKPIYSAAYTVTLDKWYVNGREENGNYVLTNTPSETLFIKPREITVTPNDDVCEYSAGVTGSQAGFEGDFAYNDKSLVTPEYTYDGSIKVPTVRGVYTLGINLYAENGLLDNYVVNNGTGTFELVKRKVRVKVNDRDAEEYIKQEYAPIDTGFKHWHDVAGGETETGFAEEDLLKATVRYYYLNHYGWSGAALKADTYTIIAEITGVEDYSVTYEYGSFTVKPRPITVETIPSETVKVYDKLPYSAFIGYTHYHVASGTRGFIDDADEALFEPEYIYIFNGYSASLRKPVNVGNYTITARYTSLQNYEIKIKEGEFKITQRKLVIAPVNKSEIFNGQTLTPDADGYKILEGELCEGDDLVVTLGGSLSAPKPTAKITITAATVNDGADGGNYNLIYEYEADCGFNRGDFNAQLTFKQRAVEIDMIYDGPNTYVYSGEAIKIQNAGYEFVFAADKAFMEAQGHIITITKSDIPSAFTGKFTFAVKVTDANGKNVTALYNIKYRGAITVEKITINVSFDKSDVINSESGLLLTGVAGLLDGHAVEVKLKNGCTGDDVADYTVRVVAGTRDQSQFYNKNVTFNA